MSKKLISIALVSCLFGFSSVAFADGMCICMDPPACTQQVCPEGNNQTTQTTTTQPVQTTQTDANTDSIHELTEIMKQYYEACTNGDITPDYYESTMNNMNTDMLNDFGSDFQDLYETRDRMIKEETVTCRAAQKYNALIPSCIDKTLLPEQFQFEIIAVFNEGYNKGYITKEVYDKKVQHRYAEACQYGITLDSSKKTSSANNSNTAPLFYDESQARGVDMTKDRIKNVMVFDFGLGVTGGAYLPFYEDGLMGDVNLNITLGFMLGGSKTWQEIHYSHGFQVETHLGYAKVSDSDLSLFLGVTDCMFTPAFYITDNRNLIFEAGVGVSFVYTNSSVWGIGIPIRLGILYYFSDNWAFGVHFVAHSNFVIGDEDYAIESALNTYSIGTEAMLQLVYRPNFFKDEVYYSLDD